MKTVLAVAKIPQQNQVQFTLLLVRAKKSFLFWSLATSFLISCCFSSFLCLLNRHASLVFRRLSFSKILLSSSDINGEWGRFFDPFLRPAFILKWILANSNMSWKQQTRFGVANCRDVTIVPYIILYFNEQVDLLRRLIYFC